MVLVYLTSDECVEVFDAVRVEADEGRLWCFDRNGRAVRSFELTDVAIYTTDPDTAATIREEACEGEDEPVIT